VQNHAPFCDGSYIAEWASRQSQLCSDEAQSCPRSDHRVFEKELVDQLRQSEKSVTKISFGMIK
jgi:hypothetical protein